MQCCKEIEVTLIIVNGQELLIILIKIEKQHISIIWLQNILEKKKIPFIFTLADNSLFYDKMTLHSEKDTFLKALYKEIDFTKWFFFGERCMGFNQWASLEEYPRGITHPLDKAHINAVKLMLPKFEQIIGGKNV